MKQPYDLEQINTMSWMRFPLIIGVVLAHCNLYALVEAWDGTTPELPEWLIFIFKYTYWIIFPPRVPTLFIISGYFFFRSQQKRDVHFFTDKFKRRLHSLLIPYIVWNAIAITTMFIRYDIIEGLDYSATDYLSGFWSSSINNNGLPANNPLWFMRNLMAVSLLSPIIYYLIKNKYGFVTVATITICYIFNIHIPIYRTCIETILFFTVGAYIAIHNIRITTIPRVIGLSALLLYVPVQLMMIGINSNNHFIYCFNLITGFIKITAIFYLISYLFRKNILKPVPLLSNMSFTLYALHGIIIGPIIMVLYRLSGNTDNPLALLGIYIATPLIILVCTYVFYKTITRYTPMIAKIVTGNRR